MARRNPIARVGNYAAPVDTFGMDPEMKKTMGVSPRSVNTEDDVPAKAAHTPLNKIEKDFIKGSAGRPSAMQAVRRARAANNEPNIEGDPRASR